MAKQEKRVTGWISGAKKPIRIGWYERKYKSESMHKVSDWWDGKEWHIGLPSGGVFGGATQNMSWRGLARRPR